MMNLNFVAAADSEPQLDVYRPTIRLALRAQHFLDRIPHLAVAVGFGSRRTWFTLRGVMYCSLLIC